MLKNQNRNLELFIKECKSRIDQIWNSKNIDSNGINEYGYIKNFLGNGDWNLNACHYAQFENMFIDAICRKYDNNGVFNKHQFEEDIKDIQWFIKNISSFVIPMDKLVKKDSLYQNNNECKNIFRDKLLINKNSFIMEQALYKTHKYESEIVDSVKNTLGIDLSYRKKYQQGKHIPYDLQINKDATLANVNGSGVVMRNSNGSIDQNQLQSMIEFQKEIEKSVSQNINVQPITNIIVNNALPEKIPHELAAGTQALSLAGKYKNKFNENINKIINESKIDKDLSKAAILINILNLCAFDNQKGYGAGISGTSMCLWMIADSYCKRNNIKMTKQMKIDIAMSIIKHVLGKSDIEKFIKFDQLSWPIKIIPSRHEEYNEALHHSLPEILMGIGISEKYIENGIKIGSEIPNITNEILSNIILGVAKNVYKNMNRKDLSDLIDISNIKKTSNNIGNTILQTGNLSKIGNVNLDILKDISSKKLIQPKINIVNITLNKNDKNERWKNQYEKVIAMDTRETPKKSHNGFSI